MAYYVGKSAAIVINGTPYCMTDWSLDLTTEEVDVTSFCSGGFTHVLGGITGGSMSASGPYTGTAPTVGTVIPVIFYVASPGGPSFTQNVLLTSVRVTQNVRDKAMLEIAGTITIV